MKTITAQELRDLREENDVPLINVLSEEDFAQAHIPGSLNIPVSSDDFVAQVKRAVGDGQEQEVVVYCASEECDASPKAARKLEKAGFTSVVDFEGGLRAWQEAGMPLEGGARK